MKLGILITAGLVGLSTLYGQGFGGPGGGAAPAPKVNQPNRGNPYGAGSAYGMPPEVRNRYFPNEPGAGQMPSDEPPFDIVFPGGTAKELIDHLRKNLGTVPNVMISPVMKDVMLPAFELHNVTLSDLFQALNNLSGDHQKGQWQLSGSTQPIWVMNPPSGIDPITGAPIGGFAAPQVFHQPKSCKIYPVGEFLGQYKVEDVTTAIQTAWGMLGDDGGAQMKLHKDTDLLIAVGTPEQLGIVSEVLASLSRSMVAKDAVKRQTERARESGSKVSKPTESKQDESRPN